jgi:hypothetical protein
MTADEEDGPVVNNPDNTPPDNTSTTSPTPAPTTAEPGEGVTGVVGGDGGEPEQHITVAGDPTGKVTNTPNGAGTLQREPKPEDLPSDAKVAPLAEQVNPANAQSVGTAPQPEQIAGVDQPKEGEKNLVADATDAAQFLPENSEQGDEADRVTEDAARNADRQQGA